jgi:hypothetical protein
MSGRVRGVVFVRRAVRLLAAGLVVLGAASCATTPPAAPAVPFGCWYFERDAAAERLNLPWGVRLLEDTLTGWPAIQQLPGVRRALTLIDHGETAAHPFGYWRPVGDDSLEIGYPAGGGLLLRVDAAEASAEPGAARLEGTARATGDLLRPDAPAADDRPAQRVVLVRAACA